MSQSATFGGRTTASPGGRVALLLLATKPHRGAVHEATEAGSAAVATSTGVSTEAEGAGVSMKYWWT